MADIFQIHRWLLVLLDALCILVIALALLINPADDANKPPGSLLVEMFWPPECAADVDLWVEAPTDLPVGYSRKNGKVGDLLRDDLGHSRDESGQNYESFFARWAPEGWWVVNLHLYKLNGCGLPLPVQVVVSVFGPEKRHLTKAKVILETERQELTVTRFRLEKLRAYDISDWQEGLREKVK